MFLVIIVENLVLYQRISTLETDLTSLLLMTYFSVLLLIVIENYVLASLNA